MGAKRWVAAGAMVGLLWLLCGHAAFTASAAAQSPASGRAARLSHGGLGLHLFRPAVDSRGHLSVDGTEILGHLDYSFGLILDAGFGMVPYHGFKTDSRVAASDAQRVSRLVDEGITGTLRFNLGLVDWLVVGLQLPISFFHGPNVQVPGVYNDPSAGAPRGLSQQGVGDPVAEVVQDTQEQDELVGLGILGEQLRGAQHPEAPARAVSGLGALDVGRVRVDAQVVDLGQEAQHLGRAAADVQDALPGPGADVLPQHELPDPIAAHRALQRVVGLRPLHAPGDEGAQPPEQGQALDHGASGEGDTDAPSWVA